MLGAKEQVKAAYSAAARQPTADHPFPVGRLFAESLGYVLTDVPDVCADAFAGVSNISMTAVIPVGSTVLDLGCGSGLDSIIAARRTGENGRVISVDFSDEMLSRASAGVTEAAISNIDFRQGDAERISAEDASVDLAIVNGIFNLNPSRNMIFRELARVMRRGGSVYSAELILTKPLPTEQQTTTNWFA
jgi:ubiquinone/menaquinone biosynthesis C-methylase UbiE